MAITAFANLKGGVGKSLISMGCAHAAAADGKRVLLIDADPQGNTSIQMTNGEISPDTPARASLADVLDRQSGVAIDDAITPSRRDGIDLLPCGFDALQVVQNALFAKRGEHFFVRHGQGLAVCRSVGALKAPDKTLAKTDQYSWLEATSHGHEWSVVAQGNANAGEHPFQELHCLILSKRMEYQDIASIRPDSTPRIGDSIP